MSITAHPPPNATAKSDALERMLVYARLGWRVVPNYTPRADGTCDCHLHGKCDSVGKHPRTMHGVKDATTDEETIRRWWRQWPGRINPGIATGRASGLVVLDVDPRNGGDVSLHRLEADRGRLPPTLTVGTGGGGLHFYFALPRGRDVPSLKLETRGYPGLELQSDGTQVIAPPSMGASGRAYAVVTNIREVAPWR
jgi:hypothetical protein